MKYVRTGGMMDGILPCAAGASNKFQHRFMETSVIIGDLDSDPPPPPPPLKPESENSFEVNGVKHAVGEAFKIISGIEMIEILQKSSSSSEYTSLKDLIPTSPSILISPMASTRLDSWREITIKDPLVKQAALSYLQPMSALQEVDTRSFLEKMKDKCLGGLFGCFGGVNDAVVSSMRSLLSEETEPEPEDDDHEVEDRVNPLLTDEMREKNES